MKYILIALCLASTFSLVGQDGYRLDWAEDFLGKGDYDRCNDMAVDHNKNYYLVGQFSGVLDFGTDTHKVLVNGGFGSQCFLLKLDSNGQFIWVHHFGDTLDQDQGLVVEVDGNGNVYVAGVGRGKADFDPDTGSQIINKPRYSYILKLDENGNFKWVKAFDEVDIRDMAIMNEQIVLTGTYEGTKSFSFSTSGYLLGSKGGDDIFILSLDTNGGQGWLKSIGGIGDDFAPCINFDKSGNIIYAGAYTYSVDFNPNSGIDNKFSFGGSDAFVSSLDSAGNYRYVNVFHSPKGASISDFSIGSNNEVVAVGRFSDSLDIDPSANTEYKTMGGTNSCFVVKTSNNGAFIWGKVYGGGKAFPTSCAIDKRQNIYVSGDIAQGSTDFDPDSSFSYQTGNPFTSSIFLQKLDSNGSLRYIKTIGSGGNQHSRKILSNLNSDLILAGYHYGGFDADPTNKFKLIVGDRGSDFFALKLSSCSPTYGTETIDTCDRLTWIDGRTYYSSTPNNQKVQYFGNNTSGCDSIIELKLTVRKSTRYTDRHTTCDSLVWINGRTYKSSTNLPRVFLKNSVGCDSLVRLNLTIIKPDTGITQTSQGWEADSTVDSYQWVNCDSNFSPLLGDTNLLFVPKHNGNYAVLVTKNGCTDTSRCFPVTGIGIKELSNANYMSIFPNPFNDRVTLEFSSGSMLRSIQIFDVSGKLVQEFESYDNQIIVHILHGSGVYFLKIREGDNLYFKQLIKP